MKARSRHFIKSHKITKTYYLQREKIKHEILFYVVFTMKTSTNIYYYILRLTTMKPNLASTT